jgi:hypothetical protein
MSSQFTVYVEMYAHQKGDIKTSFEESHNSWKEADAAWCAYKALIGVPGSRILHAELIEHRQERVHRSASKTLKGNVSISGDTANESYSQV